MTTDEEARRLDAGPDATDAQAAPDPAAPPAPQPAGAPLADLLGFLDPKRWHPAVSIALALMVTAEGAWILASAAAPGENSYRSASGGDEHPLGAGPMLIIRPNDDASWSRIDTLLTNEDLTVVSGPQDGRLTVRVNRKDADIKALMTRLRKDPRIAFVGQVR